MELEFVRIELVAAYQINQDWDAWLRVPFDVKARTANVEVVDPATPAEITAMQSNLDLHHPTKTLRGFSDLSLLAVRKRRDVFREGDILAVGFGSTLPVGQTEQNPYTLGDAGLAHEHIQFGTGTFDPLLELYYFTPLSGGLAATASVLGRFPLYENDKSYQGPTEISSGLSLAVSPTSDLSLRLGVSLFYQDFASWNGDRDINSGLFSTGIVGGVSCRVSEGVFLNLDGRFPVSQRTLSAGGDTFEQGAVVQLGLSYSL